VDCSSRIRIGAALRLPTTGDGIHRSIRFAWDFPGIQSATGDGIDDEKIPSAPASFKFGVMEGTPGACDGPTTYHGRQLLHAQSRGRGRRMDGHAPRGSPSEQHGVAGEAAGARRRGAASVARRRRGARCRPALPPFLVVVAEHVLRFAPSRRQRGGWTGLRACRRAARRPSEQARSSMAMVRRYFLSRRTLQFMA
jgi:hypothetical protein